MTFDASEASGVEAFLQQRRNDLVTHTYHPMRLRQQAIAKDGGPTVRRLSMPPIRDRVVQGARKRSLEPIVAADVPPGSSGYRPQRRAQDAVQRVAEAIGQDKTRGIDRDRQASFDTGRQHLRLAKVAQRVSAPDILPLLQRIRKASGTQGVPPGGGRSPWRSHLDLTAVDRMLERAKEVTRRGPSTSLESARFADDRVLLGEA